MTYRFSQSCICFPNLQRGIRRMLVYLASRPDALSFSRAHVCAKTLNQAQTILSYPCWHPGKATIHLWNSGWVLGFGSSPSVARVVPSLLVDYNFAYGCFSSCAHCPILCLGESYADMLYWLIFSRLAG